jgi:hypothetical protein
MDFSMDQLLAEKPEQFCINNDALAEWAARRIREHEAERDRLIDTSKTFIAHYENRIKEATERCAKDIAFLLTHLERYFDTVPHKTAKTQQTYRLPSFRLKRKQQNPDFKRDAAPLLAWAKLTDQSFVRVKEEPAWDAIKAACVIKSNRLIHPETGEVVPGVEVVLRPDVFTVEDL